MYSKKRTKKKWLLLFCLAALTACVLIAIRMDRDTFLGARILEEEEGEKYWAEATTQACLLTLQDTILPRNSSSNVTFLPQSLENSQWQGGLRAGEGCRLYFIRDEWMEDKAGAIQSNHAFRYLVLDREGQLLDKGYLVATGMAMISWHLDSPQQWDKIDGSVLEGEYTGTMTIFDPGDESSGYRVLTSRMYSRIRGNSSRYADKKSFQMDLLDSQGGERKESLCGLRNDGEWILNSLTADNSRIREKTGLDLWNRIAADNPADERGSRAVYVELVADEQYLGIYALQEPVDRKQLGASQEDILYKSAGHRWPTEEEFAYILGQSWQEGEYEVLVEEDRWLWQEGETEYSWNPVYLKINKHTAKLQIDFWPEDGQDPWQPLRTFINLMHQPDTDLDTVDAWCDRSNLIDISLFRQVIFGWDNLTNNTYYYARKTSTGWKITYVPWDLDQTFGNGWWACHNDGTMNSTAPLVLGRDEACGDGYEVETQLPALAQSQAGNGELLNRWYQLREGVFSDEALIGLLTENQSRLEQSGALIREREAWPTWEEDVDSFEAICQFVLLRMSYLDEYFDGLEKGE